MNRPWCSRACLMIGMWLIASVPSARAANPAAPPCEACHGAHGEGMAAAHVPRLAGQSADYLQKQLDDYADGTRENPIMANFAKALSEQQRARFAARYASMSAPFIPEAASMDTVTLARGHQLAYQGDETKRVAACNACHGPDGMGIAYAAPYLAGQSAEYLASALNAFRQGTRKNDAGELMRSVAERLDDADVAAVAGYFASLTSASRQGSARPKR
ncbi:MAG TPA: c-type cytochrome [Steroidobacteraceae bacterium]|nr:c-type cytochrome [Steroidobacteraceae bacterium]